MFEWVVFSFGAYSLVLSTLVIGGMFLISSWLEVVGSKWNSKGSSKTPKALLPFSILIALDLISFIYLDSGAGKRLPIERDVIWLVVLTISQLLLWTTRIMVRRNSEPSTSMVARGSKILVFTSTPCFAVMIIGVPGLLHSLR